jgi:hypothetical protein
MLPRFAVLLVLSLCALFTGCGQPGEGEVVVQYQLGEDAIAARDVVALRNTYSPDSTAWYIEGLRLAREASPTQTKALAPTTMEFVIMLRNRLDAKALKEMDVDRLLGWLIDMDEINVDAEVGVKPHSVAITGETAVLQMGHEPERASSGGVRMGGRRGRGIRAIGSIAGMVMAPDLEPIPGWTYNFVRLDGFWYADIVSEMDTYDDYIRDAAKEAGQSVPDFLAANEKENYGSLKPAVWNPVR